jgi:aspartate carbamoyltransferase catalytic subunit
MLDAPCDSVNFSPPLGCELESLKNIKNIISIDDFERQQIVDILALASQMEDVRDKRLDGLLLGTLFYEASTRTRLSFEASMLQLGGQIMGFADAMVSSAKKGETLHDSIKVASQYVDIIVIRHPLDGAARVAAEASCVPVINGGDGANQHPTQTFLDLYTISKTHEELLRGEPLTVALLGDLRYGRTVHSLIHALSHFNVRFRLISPNSLALPDTYLDFMREHHVEFDEVSDVEGALEDVDVLYATRIQEERFPDPIEYMRVKTTYQLMPKHLAGVKDGFKLLHPLPRISEIDRGVDHLECAEYFAQAGNGIPVRKALLALLLGKV